MTVLPPIHVPPRSRRDLGYEEIERILAEACPSPFGKEALAEDPFPADEGALAARLEESLEGRALAELKVTPAFGGVSDIRPLFLMIEKEAVLAPSDLREVARSLEAMGRVQDLVLSRADELPRLADRARALTDQRDLADRIGRSFDEEGALTDAASPALRELRERVRALRAEAQGLLEGLIREHDERGLLRDRNFTVRHERYVLPVRAEHQSLVEGIVHDASQTGQTVFIEPRALMGVGNRLTIAQSAVKEEEQRILVELTGVVGRRAEQIKSDLSVLGQLEAAWARGRLSARIDGRRPRLPPAGEGPALELRRARHPHLSWLRALAAEGGAHPPPVVANDVGFGRRKALVITGPNAGGKTVTLKTMGLVSLMARAGLPVPVDEDSTIPLFVAVIAVVGDDQDLAEDLSSFSGHLRALAGALAAAKEHAGRGPVLVLLDELCAGTAPAQGAALAQSVLEALIDAGATVVATTHYERLKTLALLDEEEERFRNASVALDEEGRPTFDLLLDQVGSSSAFEAARRHGLPASIIERAESLMDPTGREVQQLLDRLASENSALEAKGARVEAERQKLADKNEALSRKLDELNQEAARLRREGAKAFLDEIKEARQKVAEAIEAAQKGAGPRALNELSHQLKEEEARAAASASAPSPAAPPGVGLEQVAVGDKVRVASLPGSVLEVLEVHDGEVVVGRGPMRLRKPRSELRAAGEAPRPSSSGGPKTKGKKAPSNGRPTEPRTSDNTLDLRGVRVAEGLELLDAFLDQLLHRGKSRGYVLHGHGTGAMRKAVRDAVRSSRYVDKSGSADEEDGGEAVTVVDLADR